MGTARTRGRRRFLQRTGKLLLAGMATMTGTGRSAPGSAGATSGGAPRADAATLTLFLGGDLMTGRGIDQILPHPGDPELQEPVARSALDYVALAERGGRPLPRPVPFAYIWGDALAEIDAMRPDARIVNLETAVTARGERWPGKGIHYRMQPGNVRCLTAAGIDCCVLANNHVLDWGHEGLADTLAAVRGAGMSTAGAGPDAAAAAAPAVIDVPRKGRVLVFACATAGSGVPSDWAATRERAGVNLLPDLSPRQVDAIARRVRDHKRSGDLAVFSVHWSGNWGYEISRAQREFAHRLVDVAGIDVVHGHSSHHVKGIEVHRGRPILYGCGDLLDDYEGIAGYEDFRGELGLMYFPAFDRASGRLLRLSLAPTRIARFRVNRAADADVAWLMATLNREGRALGTRVGRRPDDTLALIWDDAGA